MSVFLGVKLIRLFSILQCFPGQPFGLVKHFRLRLEPTQMEAIMVCHTKDGLLALPQILDKAET